RSKSTALQIENWPQHCGKLIQPQNLPSVVRIDGPNFKDQLLAMNNSSLKMRDTTKSYNQE
ncbi:MAG TPA: hypothetical protein VJL89_09015, partial [Thermodesulfovibrionia bacterium]|nr:hypothetical protein [Thermodesulfovibrionia bacterium]